MNAFKKVVLTFLFTLGVMMAINAQSSIPEGIVNATRNNDSQELAQYFNTKVELILPGKSGLFTSDQAEQVIKNFFNTNPCSDFKIIHQGERDNSSFAIGKYTTKGQNFRVYYLVKESGGKPLIHQLRIEKQDE
jgi:hypothetical protein